MCEFIVINQELKVKYDRKNIAFKIDDGRTVDASYFITTFLVGIMLIVIVKRILQDSTELQLIYAIDIIAH